MAVSPSKSQTDRMLGPWMTLALVISGVVGVGIFYLPIALAPLGGSVPIGWLISGVGVMSMAYCASRIVSPDGGGLQAYVENELGAGAGFVVTWATWCSSCVGNPAVALAAAAGLASIVPGLSGHLVIVASAFFVVLTLVNLRGIKTVGELAVVTVLIKILPLIAVVVVAANSRGTRDSAAADRRPGALGRQYCDRIGALLVRADRLRILAVARRKDPEPRAQSGARISFRPRGNCGDLPAGDAQPQPHHP